MPDSSLRDQIRETLRRQPTTDAVMAVVQPALAAHAAEIERLTEERDAARMVSQGRTMEQYDQEDLKRRTERAEADREWWSRALTRAIAERDRYRLVWESARRGRRSARILARELQWAIRRRGVPETCARCHAAELLADLDPPAPEPGKCPRCRGLRQVPDWSNWNQEYGEPRPKPCPDCTPDQPPPEVTG